MTSIPSARAAEAKRASKVKNVRGRGSRSAAARWIASSVLILCVHPISVARARHAASTGTTRVRFQSSSSRCRLTLQDVEPPVWRRMEVPSDITFAKLHEILQITMGWQNSHLHQFSVGAVNFGVPSREFGLAPELMDERRARLRETVATAGTEFGYEYDFGDSWMHEITVEEVRMREPGIRYPRVLDGARACPPEDVGGVGGYEDFLAAMADATHPEHDEMLEWIGFPFDPEWFNLVGLNRTLQSLR